MSVMRFDYQRIVARRILAEGGEVLNVGCNTDPANIKALCPEKVTNLDLNQYDHILNEPMVADVIHDIKETPWPFIDNQFCLIIFGDILEHIEEEKWIEVLKEARRVSDTICITVPQDNRLYETNIDGLYHITYVTKSFLQRELNKSGWIIRDWQELDKDLWWEKYFFLTAARGVLPTPIPSR